MSLVPVTIRLSDVEAAGLPALSVFSGKPADTTRTFEAQPRGGPALALAPAVAWGAVAAFEPHLPAVIGRTILAVPILMVLALLVVVRKGRHVPRRITLPVSQEDSRRLRDRRRWTVTLSAVAVGVITLLILLTALAPPGSDLWSFLNDNIMSPVAALAGLAAVIALILIVSGPAPRARTETREEGEQVVHLTVHPLFSAALIEHGLAVMASEPAQAADTRR